MKKNLFDEINNLQKEVDIFNLEAEGVFKRFIIHQEYKYFPGAVKKSYCEFHYNGIDLIVGKKTLNGHIMMMLIGNEMEEVGTLNDLYFPKSLEGACPTPEDTAYSCFIKYPGFANTCFSTEERNYYTMLFLK
jgi:hypothetical protein